MKVYCDQFGHATPYLAEPGTKFECLNCGEGELTVPGALPAGLPEAAVEFLDSREPVPEPPSGGAVPTDYMGEGKPETKPSNPKDVVGSKKLPTHIVPSAVVRYAALAYFEGMCKYGKFNWRVAGIGISIYIDALERHLMKLKEGEWRDPKTGVPHLGSIIACAGIILDANELGRLTDDRGPVQLVAVSHLDEESPLIMAHLREMFKDYAPHQHVITDAQASPKEPQAE